MSANPDRSYLDRRAKLAAAGICITCGKRPRSKTTLRCETCSGKHNASQRRYQKKLNSDYKAARAIYLHAGADGMTFQEIGDAIGVSRTRAEQIYYRAMTKLRRECNRLGLDASHVLGRGFSMLATAEKWA